MFYSSGSFCGLLTFVWVSDVDFYNLVRDYWMVSILPLIVPIIDFTLSLAVNLSFKDSSIRPPILSILLSTLSIFSLRFLQFLFMFVSIFQSISSRLCWIFGSKLGAGAEGAVVGTGAVTGAGVLTWALFFDSRVALSIRYSILMGSQVTQTSYFFFPSFKTVRLLNGKVLAVSLLMMVQLWFTTIAVLVALQLMIKMGLSLTQANRLLCQWSSSRKILEFSLGKYMQKGSLFTSVWSENYLGLYPKCLQIAPIDHSAGEGKYFFITQVPVSYFFMYLSQTEPSIQISLTSCFMWNLYPCCFRIYWGDWICESLKE